MKKKNLIGCLSVGAAALMCGSFALGVVGLSGALKKDSYTVYADDDYYSETTYYLTETAYNKHNMEMEQKSDKGNSKYATASTKKTNASTQTEGNFVMGVSKKVWVSETVDKNGLIDSRLMSKHEIDYLLDQNSSQSDAIFTGSTELVDYTTTDFECLTISLNITVKNSIYTVTGYAHWEDEAIWGGVETAEESVYDIMAITWGGNGALYSKNIYESGLYYSGEELNIGRQHDDPDLGVIWIIEEKTWFWGDIMNYASNSLELHRKDSQLQNIATNVRLTYIHTYQSVNSDWKFSYNEEDGLAAEVNLNATEKNWKLQIAISEILY